MSIIAAAGVSPDAPPSAPPAVQPVTPPEGAPPVGSGSGPASDQTTSTPPAPQPGKPAAPIYDPSMYGKIDEKTGRPEKVPAKYWDEKEKAVRWHDVLEQHNYLQGKIGEKREKPPEQYALTEDADFAAPEGLADDPIYKAMATWGKEEGELTQHQWDSLIRRFWTASETNGREAMASELATLGKDYQGRIQNLMTTAGANFSPETVKALHDGITSAAMFTAVEELVQASLPPSLEKDGGHDSGDTLDIVDQLWHAKDESGRRKVEIDPNYREHVRQRRAAVLKRAARRA